MRTISVLLIEDDEDDHLITTELLDDIDRADYVVEWCSTPDEGLAALCAGEHDVCLLDFRLGSETGLALLERARESARRTPCILLTGQHDASIDVAAAEAGAADYLVKSSLTSELLERTIRYAMHRRELAARLEHLAFHDPLTDLPNRTLFIDRVTQGLARGHRNPGCVTLLFMDIDNFKGINDTYGHSAGDDLLTAVSGRLKNMLRLEDTVARLGGDEFAICIEERGDVTGRVAVDLARRILKELQKPFDLAAGQQVTLRSSIGIARSTHTTTASDLLRNADVAMYRAKSAGKGTWAEYCDEMGASLRRRARIEEDLRIALQSSQMRLAFQPFVEMRTDRIWGFEALSRWMHPTLGEQDPTEFIEIAEESGSILELGRWGLRSAARTANHLAVRSSFDGVMSVNVSPLQLLNPSFLDEVDRAIEDHQVAPDRLMLEVTETVMAGDRDLAITNLRKASELGVRVALDDFGTGYSSLSHLHDLPVDLLKVDRSFVARGDEPDGRSMLAAIAAMANSMGITTIAEGVENIDQLRLLVDLGYNIAQGWLFDSAVDEETACLLATTGSIHP